MTVRIKRPDEVFASERAYDELLHSTLVRANEVIMYDWTWTGWKVRRWDVFVSTLCPESPIHLRRRLAVDTARAMTAAGWYVRVRGLGPFTMINASTKPLRAWVPFFWRSFAPELPTRPAKAKRG